MITKHINKNIIQITTNDGTIYINGKHDYVHYAIIGIVVVSICLTKTYAKKNIITNYKLLYFIKTILL